MTMLLEITCGIYGFGNFPHDLAQEETITILGFTID